ncbi:MAG: alpha/beta fold hydrolase, partial [Gemmatimonadaceae bacterium]|nr:alpha/beta fold hydrolase [Chitinophagaceae bacterium]
MKKKIIFRWVKVILLVYGIVGIALYYLQDKVFFRPEKVEWDHKYASEIPYEEFNLPFDTNANMNVLRFYTKQPATKAIIYFHGNKKNIGWYAKYAPGLAAAGYEVWMIDYPGYGKSTGVFTEQRLYEYAEQMYKLVRSRFPADSIVVYGKSLGTGLAAYIASRHSCRGLILEAPYYSFTELAGHYFPVYPVGRMI